jgi:DNA adenine methylase
MQYMGSKRQIARPLSALLESIRSGRPFVDLFCGTLSVTSAMSGERYANDISRPLICLLRAVQGGWAPPESLAEAEYARLSDTRDPDDPMTAFAGFGCSFGGKWFGGYARRDSNHWGKEMRPDGSVSFRWGYNSVDIKRWVGRAQDGYSRTLLSSDEAAAAGLSPPEKARHYFARVARKSLLNTMAKCRDVSLSCCDYREGDWQGALIYADPPYLGTTEYQGRFDTSAFWDWVRSASRRNVVVASEYSAPHDFVCILAAGSGAKLSGNGTRGRRTERVYLHESLLSVVATSPVTDIVLEAQ